MQCRIICICVCVDTGVHIILCTYFDIICTLFLCFQGIDTFLEDVSEK